MKSKATEIRLAIVFVLVAALLIAGAARMLRPVRRDYGAVWGPYLAEPKNSLDYLYLGSSFAYCDVDPAAVYGESRLTGYMLTGPEQTLGQTYWYLREALRTQSPQLVILEVTGLQFDRFEHYSQVNVVYMPAGLNKLGAIFTAAEPELRTGLLFDLYFYHSRWNELTPGEAREALFGSGVSMLKGHTIVNGTYAGITDGPFARASKGDDVYRDNLAQLKKIIDLCHKKNVRLALVLHPTYNQLSPETRAAIRADLTAYDPQVTFWDWTEDTAAIGLDPVVHYYDAGHLNHTGAGLFSRWLGRYLTDTEGLVPKAQTAKNAAAWDALT